MLYHLGVAAGITIALVAAWVAVQALVRRTSPDLSSGSDVLECRMCVADGNCTCGLRKYFAQRHGSDPSEAGPSA